MEYKVYQVTLTDADVDKVNAEGHDSVPKHLRNLNLSMAYGKTDDEKRAMFAEAWSEGDYGAPVATVWARNLEEVFTVGNGMGDESRLERHGRTSRCGSERLQRQSRCRQDAGKTTGVS